MGSNDDVTVYQAVLEECGQCDCLADSTSAPVDIARNLLLDNREPCKLRLISPGEFKPWYGKCTAVNHYIGIYRQLWEVCTNSFLSPRPFLRLSTFDLVK